MLLPIFQVFQRQISSVKIECLQVCLHVSPGKSLSLGTRKERKLEVKNLDDDGAVLVGCCCWFLVVGSWLLVLGCWLGPMLQLIPTFLNWKILYSPSLGSLKPCFCHAGCHRLKKRIC